MKNFARPTVVGFGLILTALVLSGCGGGGTSYSILGSGQSFTQNASSFNNQLDILWVVDNSGSMSPLQQNMTNNFTSFIQNFQSKGYDFRMAITSTEAYKADPNWTGYQSGNSGMARFSDGVGPTTGVFVIVPTTPNLDNVFVTDASLGANGSGDERAFSSLRTAMNSNLNAGFLRSSSFFAIIILSDEDDFSLASRSENSWGSNSALDHCYVNSTMDANASMGDPNTVVAYAGNNHLSSCANQTPPDTVASYESYLDTLTQTTGATRRWNVSAITVLDSVCQKSHAAASNVTVIGQRYVQMTNDSNGILGSICDASYANSLSNIQNKIAELSTQFFLNKIPVVSTIVIQVNGNLIPQDPNNGWTYNSSANSIVFHGSDIPPQGAAINVAFVPSSVNH